MVASPTVEQGTVLVIRAVGVDLVELREQLATAASIQELFEGERYHLAPRQAQITRGLLYALEQLVWKRNRSLHRP